MFAGYRFTFLGLSLVSMTNLGHPFLQISGIIASSGPDFRFHCFEVDGFGLDKVI